MELTCFYPIGRDAPAVGGADRTRLTFAIALTIPTLRPSAAPPTPASAKAAAKAAEVDTEHLFGFTEGSDIGEAGEKELESDTTFRSGKNTGSFDDTASEFELKYTAFENFRISAAATLAYYDIGGVADMDDRRQGSLQSLSFDARFRVLNREFAPFGLTVSFEPHWGFADETSGAPIRHFGWEGDLLFDRALVPGVLFGALNVHWIPTVRKPSPAVERNSSPRSACSCAGGPGVTRRVDRRRGAIFSRLPGRGARDLYRTGPLSWPHALREAQREGLALSRFRCSGPGEGRDIAGRTRSRELRAIPGELPSGL